MPMPVSVTTISIVPSRRVSAIPARPPGGVNFTAFASRFQITCCRRAGSPIISPTS
jgi:hypothetical protein